MKPSKEQEPRPADLSRLNIDDALKVRPIPRAPANQHSNGLLIVAAVAAVVIIASYLVYSNTLNHPVAPPLTTQSTTTAPAPATTGDSTPMVPASPTQPAPAGATPTQPATP